MTQQRRWRWQTLCVFCFLLLINWHLSTVVLVLIFISIRALRERDFLLGFIVTAVLIPLGVAAVSSGVPLTEFMARVAGFYGYVSAWFAESELYWLMLPLVVIGLFTVMRQFRSMFLGPVILYGMLLLILAEDEVTMSITRRCCFGIVWYWFRTDQPMVAAT